jgi:hypothetical protein
MEIMARLLLIMLLAHTVAADEMCLNRKCYISISKELVSNHEFDLSFNYNDVYSIQSCINVVVPCYFNCLKDRIANFDNVLNQHSQKNSTFISSRIVSLKEYGKVGAYFSIAASSLFILISVYLRRYSRWIEQIILSKVVCDLILAAVMLGQFNHPLLDMDKKKIDQLEAKNTVALTSFGLEVVSLFALIWIPILFFEVRNVIMFPFSGWDTSKLVTRWCIVLIVSLAWACILFIDEIRNVANFFTYSPVIFIGREASKEGTNRCVQVFVIEIECVELTNFTELCGCFFIFRFFLSSCSSSLQCGILPRS